MSTIHVQAAGQEALDRAAKMLSSIDNGLNRAVRGAMTRSVSKLRSESTKVIREKYAISAANIRANENVTVRYSYQNGVQAYVTFAGHKIPLYRYDGASPAMPSQDTSRWVHAMINGKWRAVHPSLAAYGRQLKSESPKRFENAFVAKMQSGHIGIFERTGGVTSKGSDEIKEIMGSSVPQMLGGKAVEEALAKGAMKKFEERLAQETMRLMNGWGR